MAAAHQDTSSSSVNSEGSQMKYKIDVKKKGLFVVIKQVTHNLYFPTNAAKDDWCEANKELLNYGPDQKCLEELFHLKPSSDEVPSKSNYTGGTDLENGSGDDSFDGFMKKLCDSKEAEKPEFLMFFLMSHGFEDGKFLLACKAKVKDIDGREVSQEVCCQGREHTYGVVDGKVPTDGEKDGVNKCFARDIKDVIRQVCESKRFAGVPKVFFMQVCRGRKKKNLEGRSDPIATSSDIELFLPGFEETLVIRASTEGYISSVIKAGDSLNIPGGSLLLQSFCNAVNELQQSNQEFKRLLEDENKGSTSELTKFLEDHREDLTGGWMMNVCQHTTAMVTNYLHTEIISSEPSVKNLLRCRNLKEFERKISDSSKKDTCEEFNKKLKWYANHLWKKILITNVIKLCEEKGSGIVPEIMHYLYCKLSGYPTEDLPVLTELTKELDRLVTKIKKQSAESEVIAFILHRCCIILEKDSATPNQIIQGLKKSSAEEKDKDIVEDILDRCEKKGEDYTLDVVKYLWFNHPRVKPICKEYHPKSITSCDTELVEKLNTMIENIQRQKTSSDGIQPAGKQQPHISSSLCRKLSMIDILKTQGKAE